MSRQRRNNHLDGITPVPDVAEEGAAASGTGLNLKLLKEKKINELAAIARDFQIESASSLRKQELIFAILQAQAEKNGIHLRRGRARDPARRLRLPARAGLQLSARPGRHLRLAEPDPPLRAAHRRIVEGQIRPPKEGERNFALMQGRGDQRPGAGEGARQDPLRRPDAAASRTSGCASSTTRRRIHDARHRPGHADRQGPARPDRRSAAHRQDDAAAEDRPRHPEEPPGSRYSSCC